MGHLTHNVFPTHVLLVIIHVFLKRRVVFSQCRALFTKRYTNHRRVVCRKFDWGTGIESGSRMCLYTFLSLARVHMLLLPLLYATDIDVGGGCLHKLLGLALAYLHANYNLPRS